MGGGGLGDGGRGCARKEASVRLPILPGPQSVLRTSKREGQSEWESKRERWIVEEQQPQYSKARGKRATGRGHGR